MSRSNYANISHFGSNNSLTNNPLTYCMTQTLDNYFQHGTAAQNFGPHNQQCQLLLAEYGATHPEQWKPGGYMDQYYKLHQGRFWPNTAVVGSCCGPNTVGCMGLTGGQSALFNSAQRRFCKFPGCKEVKEPFDPNVANSPYITYYEAGDCSGTCGPCAPVCSVDASVIDDDVVMNRVLENPKLYMQILMNIYNTMKRQGTLHTLQNTKLGRFFAANPKVFGKPKPCLLPGVWPGVEL